MQERARRKGCVLYEMDSVQRDGNDQTSQKLRQARWIGYSRSWEAYKTLRVSLDPGPDCWHCKDARRGASAEAEALNVDHMAKTS